MAGTTFFVLSKKQFKDLLWYLLDKNCCVAIGVNDSGSIQYLDDTKIDKVANAPTNLMAVKNSAFANDEPVGKLHKQDGYVWHSFPNTVGEGHIMIKSYDLANSPTGCVKVDVSYGPYFVVGVGENERFLDPPAALEAFYRALVRREAKLCTRIKDAVGNSVYVDNRVIEDWPDSTQLLKEKGLRVLSDYMSEILTSYRIST